jgi:tRNA modification GTPase
MALAGLAEGDLRLCRIFDGAQYLDDALVGLRLCPGGEEILDISIHGGPRIVERVLMLLKGCGVEIVDPRALLGRSWITRNAIEREMLEVLLYAKTRMAAGCLVGLASRLVAEFERIISQIEQGCFESACNSLQGLYHSFEAVGFLVNGVRVVLLGESNTGKSMLANALADREHAVVSEFAGTTRDWVEHPGSIHGIPFIFVDTAGMRASSDPIEAEAVRRAHDQKGRGDILLWVIDSSVAPTSADRDAVNKSFVGGKDFSGKMLYVWNKSDLAFHPDHRVLMMEAGARGLAVSGLMEIGISELGELLVESLGLSNFDTTRSRLFTVRQVEGCAQALSALKGVTPDGGEAIKWLKFIVDNCNVSGEEGP